jgi:threonyl-tRNA synthetase
MADTHSQHYSEQERLAALRHSCAHLLAAAVLELFPDALTAIGPSTEQGFYYDIAFQQPITDADLERIEQKMHNIVREWRAFERHEVAPADAKKELAHNRYKIELINEHSGAGETISIYQSGAFRDLCRGGHVEEPHKQLKFFKLLNIAGAYWRGDEKNDMLTRIYGTAFFSQEELDEVNRTGRVWLGVLGLDHPPVFVAGIKPFESEIDCE